MNAALIMAIEDIKLGLTSLQGRHGLSDAEMLLAVSEWTTGKLREMATAEERTTP